MNPTSLPSLIRLARDTRATRSAVLPAVERMEGRVLLSVSNPAGPVVMTTDFAASLTPSPSPSASLTPTPTGTLLTLSDTGDAHVRDGSYAGQNFGQVTPMEVKNVAPPDTAARRTCNST